MRRAFVVGALAGSVFTVVSALWVMAPRVARATPMPTDKRGVHPLRTFRARQVPKLSQRGLGEMLGVARETVARWEIGARKVDGELLPLIVEVTGLPATKLRPDLAKLLAAE